MPKKARRSLLNGGLVRVSSHLLGAAGWSRGGCRAKAAGMMEDGAAGNGKKDDVANHAKNQNGGADHAADTSAADLPHLRRGNHAGCEGIVTQNPGNGA
jgi:hypothetical protein